MYKVVHQCKTHHLYDRSWYSWHTFVIIVLCLLVGKWRLPAKIADLAWELYLKVKKNTDYSNPWNDIIFLTDIYNMYKEINHVEIKRPVGTTKIFYIYITHLKIHYMLGPVRTILK